MPLKDLSGKSVYDLEVADFKKLFCRKCKEYDTCLEGTSTIHACMGLLESGVWDKQLRIRTD